MLTGGLLRVNASNQFDPRVLTEFQPTDSNLIFQVWGADRQLANRAPARLAGTPGRQWPAYPAAQCFNSSFSRGVHLRVLSVPLISARGPAGVLQVALNLGLLDAAQRTLSTVLVALAVFSMALSGLAGWLVTGPGACPAGFGHPGRHPHHSRR